MVKEATAKAAALIEALPYIKSFQNQIIVIKLGGSAQEDPEVLERVMTDVDFMISVGMKPVVVYGGGKRISAAMEKAGKEPVFVHGQRVTDPETMKIVASVLIDEVGHDLIQIMRKAGGRAELLNGRDQGFLLAKKKHLPEYPNVDLQCVGSPCGINKELASDMLKSGTVPLIAPIAEATDGLSKLYNINGDTASSVIARDLKAAKIVFLSDTSGIYKDVEDEESLLSSLHEKDVEDLIKEKIISGGMIPKVEACIESLKGGVGKAHIVSGYQQHALLLEIFTAEGVGSELIH
ncbi:MAG: acetylglutamate kinase [Planctomycetota bacterium]|jgi:acetylglutamate kinase